MNNWLSPLYSLLFLALWRVSYETANSVEPAGRKHALPAASSLEVESPPTPQKEWAEKAVRKYTEAQDKKWRNWQDTMFEAE